VMRFAPDRITIHIKERTPVAFAQIGSRIMLADASGVLMDLTSKKKYSFPVILGMTGTEPLSTRSEQMKIYNDVVRQLDSEGAHYSQDLSEVDLSDPEDVKVLTNDPEGGVLVHLGSSNYLDRYKIYVAHLRGWREQFQKIESVDLRYDRQIIVNPDLRGTAHQPQLSAKAAKDAMAAGVKQAALVRHEPVKTAAHTAAKPHPVKVTVKPAAQRAPVKQHATAHKAPPHAAKPWKPSPHRATTNASHPKPVARASQSRSTRVASGKPSPAIMKGQESH